MARKLDQQEQKAFTEALLRAELSMLPPSMAMQLWRSLDSERCEAGLESLRSPHHQPPWPPERDG